MNLFLFFISSFRVCFFVLYAFRAYRNRVDSSSSGKMFTSSTHESRSLCTSVQTEEDYDVLNYFDQFADGPQRVSIVILKDTKIICYLKLQQRNSAKKLNFVKVQGEFLVVIFFYCFFAACFYQLIFGFIHLQWAMTKDKRLNKTNISLRVFRVGNA